MFLAVILKIEVNVLITKKLVDLPDDILDIVAVVETEDGTHERPHHEVQKSETFSQTPVLHCLSLHCEICTPKAFVAVHGRPSCLYSTGTPLFRA